ncbi:MAG: SRPBCC domain-containing protein [Thermoplasmata archaeon]
MKTRTIRQVAWVRAPPNAVYDALMTTRGHTGFTGAASRISGRVGGKFMAWDGYIHGTNLELIRGRTIVQAWRPTEESWPADHDSVVRFSLTPYRGGTRIRFTHSRVPSGHAGHLAKGWKDHYWAPLKAYLET